jgi:hypothetical protein
MSQLYRRLGTTEKSYFLLYIKDINVITTHTYIVFPLPPIQAVKEAGSIRPDREKERRLFSPSQIGKKFSQTIPIISSVSELQRRVPPMSSFIYALKK